MLRTFSSMHFLSCWSSDQYESQILTVFSLIYSYYDISCTNAAIEPILPIRYIQIPIHIISLTICDFFSDCVSMRQAVRIPAFASDVFLDHVNQYTNDSCLGARDGFKKSASTALIRLIVEPHSIFAGSI